MHNGYHIFNNLFVMDTIPLIIYLYIGFPFYSIMSLRLEASISALYKFLITIFLTIINSKPEEMDLGEK